GTGGVWDATARDQVVKGGTPIRVRFGLDERKTLRLTPRDDLWVAGFSTVEETSGESLFTNQVKGAKTLHFTLGVEAGGKETRSSRSARRTVSTSRSCTSMARSSAAITCCWTISVSSPPHLVL